MQNGRKGIAVAGNSWKIPEVTVNTTTDYKIYDLTTVLANRVEEYKQAIEALGGKICPTCGTVYRVDRKCPVCYYEKWK